MGGCIGKEGDADAKMGGVVPGGAWLPFSKKKPPRRMKPKGIKRLEMIANGELSVIPHRRSHRGGRVTEEERRKKLEGREGVDWEYYRPANFILKNRHTIPVDFLVGFLDGVIDDPYEEPDIPEPVCVFKNVPPGGEVETPVEFDLDRKHLSKCF
jgi:hypothetical protein